MTWNLTTVLLYCKRRNFTERNTLGLQSESMLYNAICMSTGCLVENPAIKTIQYHYTYSEITWLPTSAMHTKQQETWAVGNCEHNLCLCTLTLATTAFHHARQTAVKPVEHRAWLGEPERVHNSCIEHGGIAST